VTRELFNWFDAVLEGFVGSGSRLDDSLCVMPRLPSVGGGEGEVEVARVAREARPGERNVAAGELPDAREVFGEGPSRARGMQRERRGRGEAVVTEALPYR
jgi:hypothetical protein